LKNNSEQRRKARKEIEQHISVKDSILDLEVGRVVNMNEDGFMLIGSGQIRENCLYQLSMSLSEPLAGAASLSLGAECLWIRETDSGSQYWAGFHIIDISEADKKLVAKLVG